MSSGLLPKIDVSDEVRPKFLNEEQIHGRYSVDSAEKHYKDVVYYKQRNGGDGWFHGRISRAYRENYDSIFRKVDKNGQV